MGQYRITIEGVGLHHNQAEGAEKSDADKLAAKFVEDLRAAGHNVTGANIVVNPGTSDLRTYEIVPGIPLKTPAPAPDVKPAPTSGGVGLLLPARSKDRDYRATQPTTVREAERIAVRAYEERLGPSLVARAQRMATQRNVPLDYSLLEDAGELAADELGQ